jgi:hypothetical protein
MKYGFAIALGAIFFSGTAQAALTGTEVNGSLQFNGGGNNYFDPANGFVPAGYGNSAGQPVTIGSGTEFGFQDNANTDTADFTDSQLIIGDAVGGDGAAPWEMTFTSLSGAFGGLSLASSNFDGLTYSLAGNTITIDWAGGSAADTNYTATFDIAPAGVPEPATWAMMLVGFGAIGLGMRRRRALLNPAQLA